VNGDLAFLMDASYLPLTCTANACTSTLVLNSDHSAYDTISGRTGDVVSVICNEGYSGSGSVTCQTDGSFRTDDLGILECTANTCTPTQVANSYNGHSEAGSISGRTGDAISIYCLDGYSPPYGDVLCQTDGSFTAFSCTPNACNPTQVENST
jgi:hypothetical protein